MSLLRKTVELRLLAWRFDFSPSLLKSLDLPGQSAIFLYRRNLTRGYSLITLSRLKSRFFPFLSYSLVSFIYCDKSLHKASDITSWVVPVTSSFIHGSLAFALRPASVHPEAVVVRVTTLFSYLTGRSYLQCPISFIQSDYC